MYVIRKTSVFKNNHPRIFSNTHTLNPGPVTARSAGPTAVRILLLFVFTFCCCSYPKHGALRSQPVRQPPCICNIDECCWSWSADAVFNHATVESSILLACLSELCMHNDLGLSGGAKVSMGWAWGALLFIRLLKGAFGFVHRHIGLLTGSFFWL